MTPVIKRRILLALVVTALLTASAAYAYYGIRNATPVLPTYATSNSVGARYLRKFAATIQEADAITVVEHSHVEDYIMLHDTHIGYQEKIYETVQVKPEDKAKFLDIINRVDPKPTDYASGCIHEPHHLIKFFKNGKEFDHMDVCFMCSDINWGDRRSGDEPRAIYEGLAEFIAGIGLHPKADWYEKFRAESQR